MESSGGGIAVDRHVTFIAGRNFCFEKSVQTTPKPLRKMMMTMLTVHSENDMELISKMAFKADDVLKTEREKIRRHANLLKAAVLDSLDNIEVVLTLEDKESMKLLRSRIIATGDERVMLEKGLTIPVQCIRQVDFP